MTRMVRPGRSSPTIRRRARRRLAERLTDRRRAHLVGVLAPAEGLAVPGLGRLDAVTEGWTRFAGHWGLDVHYRRHGETVGRRFVAEADDPPSGTLLAEHLEVAPQWQGRGLGGHLQHLTMRGAGTSVPWPSRRWTRVLATCDSGGKVRWLGVFDWDLTTPAAVQVNASTVRSWLVRFPAVWRQASQIERQQLERFVSLLDSRSKPVRIVVSLAGHVSVDGHPADRVDDAPLVRVLQRVSTADVRQALQTAGPAASRLVATGTEWKGICHMGGSA